MKDLYDRFGQADGTIVPTYDRDEHNGSIIAKDISRLDLDVSSMFEESSAESRDPVLSENTGSPKLNTSITSPSKAKLLTADLSQVFCDNDWSMADENDFASSSSVKKAHVDDREEHNDSIIAQDISRLDLDVSSMFEESSAECRDPSASQSRHAGTTNRCESSDISPKLNTSRTSPSRCLHRKRCQPHHKCLSMNEALSSIMKPPRYSSSNTRSIDSSATKPLLMRRNSMSSALSSSFSPSKPRRNSADQWIASGVVFNSSVEVYLFVSD
eukprot:scaffold26725_cov218-Skeletonema_menzelii.AAC.2